MGPRTHLSLCACKRACLASQLLVSMGARLHLWFLDAKRRLWTRTTSLYGSQVSPVVLCMQNSVISTRITSLYGAQPSSVVFACKTATSGPESQVSMGLRPHLSFSTCKTPRLAPELLVSMGPSPHLWFLDVKQRLLDQNHKSLWVPHLTCPFVHAKQRD